MPKTTSLSSDKMHPQNITGTDWMITVNNYDDKTMQTLNELAQKAVYCGYGLEICPKTKTPHMHILVSLAKKTTRKYLAGLFHGHALKLNDWKTCIPYARKEGQYRTLTGTTIAQPGSVITETFIVAGQRAATSVYIRTETALKDTMKTE